MLTLILIMLLATYAYGYRGIVHNPRSSPPLKSTIIDMIKADVEGNLFPRDKVISILTEEIEKIENAYEEVKKANENTYEEVKKANEEAKKANEEAKKANEEAKKANEEAKKAYEKIVDKQNAEIATFKAENLLLRSEKLAIVSMRAVLEVMLRLWKPNESPTKSSQDLCKEMLDNGKFLSKECLEDLQKLEVGGAVSPLSVVSEIKDMYHELSKQIHYPEVADTGIICGGSLPLRVAVGLAFLKLQRLSNENKRFQIKYVNNEYKVQKVLRNGEVFPP
jgi:vacuolar-type H+-ATPase subunit H